MIARLNVGGPAMHVVHLASRLDSGRWRTRLIAGSVGADEGDMEYYAHDRGVTVIHLPELTRSLNPFRDIVALWGLFRLFRSECPDIVHTHTAKAGTLGRLAAILAGVPVRIHTYHGHVLGGSYFAPTLNRLFTEIERQLARGTHRLVVLTRGQAREMAEELEIAPLEHFSVIPLGLDLGRFRDVDPSEQREDTCRRLGLDADAATVGIVGRLVPVKNHELFLSALAGVREVDGRAVHGVVVGAGERETELRDLADRLRISDRVTWLGWRRDLHTVYPALDLVALTSHDEGTPVALLEAMACGINVAAREVGGVGEILTEAGAGHLIPEVAGAREWAVAIRAALTADRPSPETRDRIVRRFSVERLAADVEELYRRELKSVGEQVAGE